MEDKKEKSSSASSDMRKANINTPPPEKPVERNKYNRPVNTRFKSKKRKKWRKRNFLYGFFFCMFLTLALSVAALTIFLINYNPGRSYAPEDPPGVVYNDLPFDEDEYFLFDGRLFIRYDSIRDVFDSSIFWEPGSNRVVVTTQDKLIDMDVMLLETNINYSPVSVEAPVYMEDETPFVSMDFLAPIYNIEIEYKESGVVIIGDYSRPFMIAEATSDLPGFLNLYLAADRFFNDGVFLRQGPGHSSLRVKEIMPGEELVVFHEKSGWYKARTEEGLLGYINKNDVKITEIVEKRKEEKFFSPPFRPVGEKINLTWDYMSFTRQNMDSYEYIPGLNVISPTWFHLSDEKGNLTSHGSKAYVDWAHSNDLQVWALFSNNFDPDMTSVVIRDFELRKKMITQLMLLSELLNIDGINIDFENVYYEDRDYLTQFVREMTPMLRELGLTVSMDVTIISTSPNWSMVYDRVELAKVLDYIAVMTYDEHWAASPVAGSVASLPWVRSGVERILEQIPAHKLILGIPFYARVWEIKTDESGRESVSSRAYSMAGIRNILEEHDAEIVFDEKTGQHFASYQDGGNTYKIWIEDEVSIRSRIRLVHEYNLAGVASWRKGFEDPHIWDAIKEELSQQRP